MKKLLKKFWLHFKAETPKIWNWVAGLAAGIPLLIAAINEATSTVIIPAWYANNQFYILAGAAIITFYAKTRTTSKAKEEIQQKLG